MEDLFKLGEIKISPRARDKMKTESDFKDFVFMSLGKYKNGIWGNVGPDIWRSNDMALGLTEGHIDAFYTRHGAGDSIAISTDLGKNTTTIAFPFED